MKSFNSYANKFENLDFLNSLPNKDKLQKLNFYGNDLKKVDLGWLMKNFPNLQGFNVENNPVGAEGLQNLSSEQLSSLCEKIKDRKFRVNAYKGTILTDLLFYLQSLIKKGDGSHRKELQMIQQIVGKETSQKGVSVGWWILGGMGILAVLLLGYWWGKKKYKEKDWEDESW